jgi:hypothetical protein
MMMKRGGSSSSESCGDSSHCNNNNSLTKAGDDVLSNDRRSQDAWNQRLKELVAFKSKFGTTVVPLSKEYDEYKSLARWANNKRLQYHKDTIPDNERDELNRIGFDWKQSRSELWNEYYRHLVKYKAETGHTRVPGSYAYQEEAFDLVPLRNWCRTQRVRFKNDSLEVDRVAKLDKLGFNWVTNKDAWNSLYSQLVEFHLQTGHTIPPSDALLGKWAKRLPLHKHELRKEQIERLDMIGFEWNVSSRRSPAANRSHAAPVNHRLSDAVPDIQATSYWANLSSLSQTVSESSVAQGHFNGGGLLSNTQLTPASLWAHNLLAQYPTTSCFAPQAAPTTDSFNTLYPIQHTNNNDTNANSNTILYMLLKNREAKLQLLRENQNNQIRQQLLAKLLLQQQQASLNQYHQQQQPFQHPLQQHPLQHLASMNSLDASSAASLLLMQQQHQQQHPSLLLLNAAHNNRIQQLQQALLVETNKKRSRDLYETDNVAR